jgi:hypothetical protein
MTLGALAHAIGGTVGDFVDHRSETCPILASTGWQASLVRADASNLSATPSG